MSSKKYQKLIFYSLNKLQLKPTLEFILKYSFFGYIISYIINFLLNEVAKSLVAPLFSPDSWSLYEISKTIFSDYYKINTIRQTQYSLLTYSVSFPPLHPTLTAITRKIVDLGYYNSYFLNLAILFVTSSILFIISLKLTRQLWFGLGLNLILIQNKDYLDEVFGGRTIPLNLLILLILFLFFLRDNVINKKDTIILAIISGLLVLNRFDTLLLTLLLGPVLFVINTHKIQLKSRLVNLVIYFSVLFITMLPWVLYSLYKHGSLFVSESSKVAFSSKYIYPTYYLTKVSNGHTIFLEFDLWYNKLLTNWDIINTFFFRALASNSNLVALITTLCLVLLIKLMYFKNITFEMNFDSKVIKITSFVFVLFLGLTTTLLAGYGDTRYFINILFFLSLLLFYLCYITIANFSKKQYIFTITFFLLIFVLFHNLKITHERKFTLTFENSALNSMRIIKKFFYNKDYILERRISPDYKNLALILEHYKPVRVMIDARTTYINPYEFGALTGIETVIPPHNLNYCTFILIIKNLSINFIYSTNPNWIKSMTEYFDIEVNKDNINLYKVIKFKNELNLNNFKDCNEFIESSDYYAS